MKHTNKLSKTPLDEEFGLSQRPLYLTTYNTRNRQTSMPPAGFESEIPASEQPQTHPLHCTATGISLLDKKG